MYILKFVNVKEGSYMQGHKNDDRHNILIYFIASDLNYLILLPMQFLIIS